jgi:hypothetical protein
MAYDRIFQQGTTMFRRQPRFQSALLVVAVLLGIQLFLIFQATNEESERNLSSSTSSGAELFSPTEASSRFNGGGVLVRALQNGGREQSLRADKKERSLQTQRDYDRFVNSSHIAINDSMDDANVVVFVCNHKYSAAVADSIVGLRIDGGYQGDVAVILQEDEDLSIPKMQEMILDLLQKRIDKAFNSTISMDATSLLEARRRLFFFSVQDLLNSLLDGKPNLCYLGQPPPLSPCKEENRRNGHAAYYRKLLIYHPSIALRWQRVLYMDACMTFHRPYVDWMFDLSAKQQPGKLLAALDPWRWRQKRLMKGQLLLNSPAATNSSEDTSEDTSCTLDPNDEALLRRLVLGNERKFYLPSALSETAYFNSALVLYDTSIVTSYTEVTQSADSTVIELMILYHLLGKVFKGGDQVIQSVYWMYLRDRKEFGILEREFWDDGEMVPYTFEPPPTGSTEVPILSGGNLERAVCRSRPVNKAPFDEEENLSLEEKRQRRWEQRRHQREWRQRQKAQRQRI